LKASARATGDLALIRVEVFRKAATRPVAALAASDFPRKGARVWLCAEIRSDCEIAWVAGIVLRGRKWKEREMIQLRDTTRSPGKQAADTCSTSRGSVMRNHQIHEIGDRMNNLGFAIPSSQLLRPASRRTPNPVSFDRWVPVWGKSREKNDADVRADIWVASSVEGLRFRGSGSGKRFRWCVHFACSDEMPADSPKEIAVEVRLG